MAGRHRILLVDDELSVIKTVGRRLEIEGFELLTALDGREALVQARAGHPDLIILDLMLPKLNGYEVCTQLKQDAELRAIPVVIFTAKTQERDEAMAMACGADAYVRKPFRSEELLTKVRALLPPPSAPA